MGLLKHQPTLQEATAALADLFHGDVDPAIQVGLAPYISDIALIQAEIAVEAIAKGRDPITAIAMALNSMFLMGVVAEQRGWDTDIRGIA